MSDLRRIEIGFDGGQVFPLRVADKDLDGLRDALGSDGWHKLVTEDAEVDIDLAKIVFVRAAGEHQKVGF